MLHNFKSLTNTGWPISNYRRLLWNTYWVGTWIKLTMELLLQSGRSKMTGNANWKSYSTVLFRERHLFPRSSFFFLSFLNDLLRTVLKNQPAPLVNSYLLFSDQFNSSYYSDDSNLNESFWISRLNSCFQDLIKLSGSFSFAQVRGGSIMRGIAWISRFWCWVLPYIKHSLLQTPGNTAQPQALGGV